MGHLQVRVSWPHRGAFTRLFKKKKANARQMPGRGGEMGGLGIDRAITMYRKLLKNKNTCTRNSCIYLFWVKVLAEISCGVGIMFYIKIYLGCFCGILRFKG